MGNRLSGSGYRGRYCASQMIESELLNKVSRAFSAVPKPTRFTRCGCAECRVLNAALIHRTSESLTEVDLRHSSCLLSSEAFQYLVPGLVRLSLTSGARDSDLADHFLAELCAPISKDAALECLPRATSFTAQQKAAVLAFLVYIRDNTDWEYGQPSREIIRGIKNWQLFLKVHEERH